MILIEDDLRAKTIKSEGFILQKNKIEEALRIMKSLSFEIQRKNPEEWNEFLDIGMQKQVQEGEYQETEYEFS